MKRIAVSTARALIALAGAGVCFTPSLLHAQANPFAPNTAAMDTLNEGSVGPNAKVPMDKARAAAATANAQVNPAPAAPAAPGFAPPPVPPAPSTIPGVTSTTAAQIDTGLKAVTTVLRTRVKAIYGKRVFDAVTGEMLDDAQIMYVDQDTKDQLGLVDNGDKSKGDLVPEDQVWTAVEVSREYVGQSNQRLKERLIQAISSAEQLTPLEFFGYHILTTERINPLPRNRTWKLVKDPKGRGKMLAEQEVDKPVQIPKFREEENRKDDKIAGKDGWAIRFLDEYRLKKGDVESEFYQVYVPKPPVAPAMPPPSAAQWKPFSKPAGLDPGQANDPGRSKQGYKIKTQTQNGANPLGDGAPTSQPYFNSSMTQKAFGVNTGRR